MKFPKTPIEVFKKRRQNLISSLEDNTAMVLFSQPVYWRQHDIPFLYRQDSSFYYFTGFEESEACLVLRKKHPSSILFVQDKDPKKEMWDGVLYGSSRAEKDFQMDRALNISEFENTIGEFLRGMSHIYQLRQVNLAQSQKLDQIIVSEKTKSYDNAKLYQTLDAKNLIAKMRMIKSPSEIENIRKACEISKMHTLR